jgi:hypothetical protein
MTIADLIYHLCLGSVFSLGVGTSAAVLLYLRDHRQPSSVEVEPELPLARLLGINESVRRYR